MKSLWTLMLVVVLASGILTACAGDVAEKPVETETANEEVPNETVSSETIQIGWSANGLNGPNSHLDEMLKAYFEGKEDVNLIATNAELDATQQISDIETMIDMGCKVIMLKPQDSASLANVLQEAMDAGITVILVEAFVYDASGNMVGDIYVGYDDVTIGKMLGEEVVAKADGEPYNICIYEGQDGNSTFNTRRENFLSVVEQYDNIKILASQSGVVGRTDDMTITENWLSAYDTEIDGIVAFTDESAIGACMALMAEDYYDEIDVFTCNGTSEAMRYMIDGGIDVLLPLASGLHPSVGIAYMIATGQAEASDFPEIIYGGIASVTPQMCEEYLAMDSEAYRMDDIDPANNILFTETFAQLAKEYPMFENYPFE